MEVPETLVKTEWKPDLVHQAVVAQDANSRDIIAHAKDRSEVRGGGRKPWKQKGTGRARHGSIRSPIWVGGGATFGPSIHRIFAKKINKKMSRTALMSVLSKKIADKQLMVIESLEKLAEAPKTSVFNSAIAVLLSDHKKILFVFSETHKQLVRAARNVPGVSYCGPRSLNVRDLLAPSLVVIEQEALQELITHHHIN